MKKHLRLSALLLCAVLLLTVFTGCGDTRSFSDRTADPTDAQSQAKTAFEEATFAPATALALGMRFFDDPAYLDSVCVVWNILGWYCAGQEADGGKEYLTQRQVNGLQHCLRPKSTSLPAPDNWISGGSLEVTEEDGETRYYFPGFRADYDLMMDALRPQITAGTADAQGVTPVTVVLTDSENETTETYVFNFRRDARASAGFPYVVDGMTLPPVETAQETAPGAANFTLSDVANANLLTNLLSIFSSVEIRSSFGGEDGSVTSYFKKNGEICSVDAYEYEGESGYSGFYGERWFSVVKDEDDLRDVHLQSYLYLGEEMDGDGPAFDYEITSMIEFGRIVNLTEKGDVYSFDVELDYGYEDEADPPVPVHYEIDNGSLALRSIVWDSGTEYESSRTFRYNTQVDTHGLLDGWDRPLRTVTFVVELHDETGKATTETIKTEVPENLELLPEMDGDFAVYNDAAMTKEYTYPGLGPGYTIYVTDAMG
ncbi:MAG: hypothetical protein IK080_06480 [Clostridia bacterium]|nr:hypothetical protein [Clostridia bacterium]